MIRRVDWIVWALFSIRPKRGKVPQRKNASLSLGEEIDRAKRSKAENHSDWKILAHTVKVSQE